MKAAKFIALSAMAVSFLLAGIACPAFSQDKPADNMEIVREKIMADKKLFIAANMGLTEKEDKAFWPVYEAYQKELNKLVDRSRSLIEGYARNYESMSDQKAVALMENFLSINEDRAKLMKAYFPKFSKALPALKVARYYQIENKIHALVSFDLARQIPMIQ
jgi:hypothetical protein